MSLGFATRLYNLQSKATVSETVIEHEGFEEFCFRLQRLVQVTSDLDDDSWVQPLRKLRHYRFDQCAGPIGFGNIGVMSDEKLKTIEDELSYCSSSYNHLSNDVSEIISCLKKLVLSNDNPLLDALINQIADNRKTAILLKEARHISLFSEILNGDSLSNSLTSNSLHIVSQNQLSKVEETFDLLLCVGRSGWFNEFVFRAPRATETRVLRYSWLPDSDCRMTSVFKGWRELSGKLEKDNKLKRKSYSATIGSTTGRRTCEWKLSDDELVPKFDLAVIAGRFESGNTDDATIKEDVAARLVELEGRRGTFIEDDSGGPLVIDLYENEHGIVGRVPVNSIMPGMFLLLRGDSDTDIEYIIPIANLILGRKADQLRRFQHAWKTKLKELVIREGISKVVEMLTKAGSKKANETNLRNWLWHRNIRTDAPEDFYAIMRTIDMGDFETKCWGYARQIDSAHRKAGRKIRSELLRQVRAADLKELEQLGEMRFELEGIGGRPMLAVRVVRVSGFTSNIAPQNLNHLFHLEENLNG